MKYKSQNEKEITIRNYRSKDHLYHFNKFDTPIETKLQ